MDDITQETGQETTPAVTTETTPNAVDTGVENTAEPQATDDNPYLLPLDEDAASPADNTGLDQYLTVSPYINSPETLQGAIADSHLLHDIINGQQPVGNMLEGLRQNNPQVFQNIVNGLAQYIQQQTGYAFVDPKSMPQPENADPVQQRLQAIEQQFQSQERQRTEQAQQYRASQAQRVLLDHLTTSLKGSFLEGDEARALSLLGSKLGGNEDKIIAAIEKGDFKSIDAALKQVKRDETDLYNRYAKRIQAQRKATVDSLPKVDNPGTTAAPRKGNFDLSTRDGRIAAMNAGI